MPFDRNDKNGRKRKRRKIKRTSFVTKTNTKNLLSWGDCMQKKTFYCVIANMRKYNLKIRHTKELADKFSVKHLDSHWKRKETFEVKQ